MDMHKLCSDALARAVAFGAQAEVSLSSTRRTELNADHAGFSLMRTTFGHAFSVKVIREGRKGSASTNSADPADLAAAVDAALSAAESSPPDPAEGVSELCEPQSFADGPAQPDRDVLFSRSAEFLSELSERWPSISLDSFVGAHVCSDRLYLNTNGVRLQTLSGVYAFSAMFYAKDGERTSSFASTGFYTPYPDRPISACADFATLLDDCVRQLSPVPLSGKFCGPVIATPAAVGDLLGSALEQFASTSPLIEGTSVWRDKLGQAVASPLLSVRSDPGDSRLACPSRVTRDGYVARPMDIISGGVLKGFLLNRYGAARTGFARAQNDGDDLIVSPGDTPLSDMIAGVERGLLLCRISGGEPASNGDFSAIAKNSFLIENGRIGPAVCETMVSGNLSAMLQSISAVSRETVCDGAGVMPYVRFEGLTLSGK